MTKPTMVKTKQKKAKLHFRDFKDFKEWLRRNISRILISILRYALLICIGYIILLPILEMVSTVLKPLDELGSPVSKWVPAHVSNENLYVGYQLLKYPTSLTYTFFTTLLQVIIQTVSAAFAGYAFARVKSKLIKSMFIGVILSIVVPQSVLMLPQYIFFRNFDIFGIIKLVTGNSINLLNSPIVLYILDFTGMGLKSGLYIYIFRQFFRGLPKELEEAAYVDGCGFVRTLFKIVMPNATPGIITVATLSFVWNWNDTYFNSLFVKNMNNLMLKLTSSSSKMDQALKGISRAIPANFEFDYNNLLYQDAIVKTCSLLIILPLLILYLIIQRKFVESASRSGIVG